MTVAEYNLFVYQFLCCQQTISSTGLGQELAGALSVNYS